MDIIKTKNVNLVLYSIIRQLVRGETLTYVVEDETPVNVTIDKCSEKRNSILVMKGIANIKRALNNDNHVTIKTESGTYCGISKEEEFYYVDNGDEVLKHVIFELILGNNEIGVSLDSKNVFSCKEKYFFAPCFEIKSKFFNDYSTTKEMYDLTEDITKKIVADYASENDCITLVNDRETFTFSLTI